MSETLHKTTPSITMPICVAELIEAARRCSNEPLPMFVRRAVAIAVAEQVDRREVVDVLRCVTLSKSAPDR